MHRLPLPVLLLLLLLAALPRPAFAQADAAASLTAPAASFAEAVEGLPYGDFLYGRFGAGWPRGGDDLAKLRQAPFVGAPVADVVGLLAADDPRVRTVGMLLLFDRGDTALLPHLAARLDDDGAAIPWRIRGTRALIGGQMVGQEWIERPCTVGQVAAQLLEFCYEHHGRAEGRTARERFEAFWRPREGRAPGLGDWRLRLMRAWGGQTPLAQAAGPALAAVRRAVDELPASARDLVLVAAPAMHWPALDAFATVEERIVAARRLGDDALLAALAGDFEAAFGAELGSDPDLPGLSAPNVPSSLHDFVLTPARQVFAAASAERLLALEQARWRDVAEGRSEWVRAGWVTTAASLDPKRGPTWLREALKRFAGPMHAMARAQLLAGIARFSDPVGEQEFVQQFWGSDVATPFGGTIRPQIVDALAPLAGEKRERVMTQLLEHEAFDAADVEVLVALDRLLTDWLGEAPLTEAERRMLHAPRGVAAPKAPDPAPCRAAIREAWRSR